ncbi:SH3 domain-containing protein [Novosphingobium mangrovi (ex Huang et al. 2023)]|uniref:SH3 domain-containing protein n=1 Tax=Novosphingobium mangrovi (ex Huang et al. 2023) TaxID=2976432 RepID=A0ABT2I3V4_9SPHN|nr:SH3 domain-containing protein [Novosphingobium mangrovi (ex Huang et al. 2023)]MCT2399485.1 SH3 domain-containing protein [Novosphingobium mangrovi (ex Huang et al. 2023)]
MISRLSLLPMLALCVLAAPAVAADDDKVPYWASIDADVANMRVGPGGSYKIDWVYRRLHLPVKIIRREGPWRQIEDPDGDKGWMRDLLLSRQRTAIVIGKELIEMHADGNDSSAMLWRLEPGVVGLLGECAEGWCTFDVDGHKGFVNEANLWGAGEP